MAKLAEMRNFGVYGRSRGSGKLQDIAIARHHFDAALAFVTPAAPALDSQRLLLAG